MPDDPTIHDARQDGRLDRLSDKIDSIDAKIDTFTKVFELHVTEDKKTLHEIQTDVTNLRIAKAQILTAASVISGTAIAITGVMVWVVRMYIET